MKKTNFKKSKLSFKKAEKPDVEKLVWQALFELMLDQGVVNIGAIKAVVKS